VALGDQVMGVSPHAKAILRDLRTLGRVEKPIAMAQTLRVDVRSDSTDFLLVAKHWKVTIRSFRKKRTIMSSLLLAF
jgi:hypothetical protein